MCSNCGRVWGSLCAGAADLAYLKLYQRPPLCRRQARTARTTLPLRAPHFDRSYTLLLLGYTTLQRRDAECPSTPNPAYAGGVWLVAFLLTNINSRKFCAPSNVKPPHIPTRSAMIPVREAWWSHSRHEWP